MVHRVLLLPGCVGVMVQRVLLLPGCVGVMVHRVLLLPGCVGVMVHREANRTHRSSAQAPIPDDEPSVAELHEMMRIKQRLQQCPRLYSSIEMMRIG